MQISDFVQDRPTGLFLLDVFRRGELIERYEDHNLVVDNYKTIHAKLLGGSFANQSITQFGVGTSGAAPVGGNTALTGAFLKALDSITYPASNQVSFNFSLASTEANGMAISEFGLLTANNTLYARKVRSAALSKDTDLQFQGSWIISF